MKAEREDGKGRLHINKAMLREWRQDFAQEMRRQGIAANATPRSVRGQTQRAAKDVFYRTQARGQSYALREKLDDILHGFPTATLLPIRPTASCSRPGRR